MDWARRPSRPLRSDEVAGRLKRRLRVIDGLVDALGAELALGLVGEPHPKFVGDLLGTPLLCQKLSRPPWQGPGRSPRGALVGAPVERSRFNTIIVLRSRPQQLTNYQVERVSHNIGRERTFPRGTGSRGDCRGLSSALRRSLESADHSGASASHHSEANRPLGRQSG